MASTRSDFAFESTLSGLTYIDRITRWKQEGYRIELVYLQLDSPELALKRIAMRVKQGGHDVPAADVRRRFVRSWLNFQKHYRPLCNAWWLYDATGYPPILLNKSP